MNNRAVALFHSRRLLGESLEQILLNLNKVQILGPWMIASRAIEKLANQKVDLVIVIDEENNSDQAPLLIGQILETYSGLPVIQVRLESNQMRIYNSQTIPANSKDLISAIQTLCNS